MSEQVEHQRYGVHSSLEAFGRTQTTLDWSRSPSCRVPLLTLLDRLNDGWDPRRAMGYKPRGKQPGRQRGIDKKSSYRGVSWHRASGLWLARVYDPDTQRTHQVGYFEDELDAARAYDQSARERLGRSAKLNFPADKLALANTPS
jgi:hypothetical protein